MCRWLSEATPAASVAGSRAGGEFGNGRPLLRANREHQNGTKGHASTLKYWQCPTPAGIGPNVNAEQLQQTCRRPSMSASRKSPIGVMSRAALILCRLSRTSSASSRRSVSLCARIVARSSSVSADRGSTTSLSPSAVNRSPTARNSASIRTTPCHPRQTARWHSRGFDPSHRHNPYFRRGFG